MHLRHMAGLATFITSIIVGTVVVGANPPSVETASTSPTTSGVVQNSEAAAPTEDAKAYGMLKNSCMGCHDLSMLTSRPIAASEWPSILSKMKGFGASLTDEESALLERYLAKTYSPPQTN